MMMSGAAGDATTAAAAGSSGGGSSGSVSLHITKDNIESVDYFQLFGLSVPINGAGTDDIDISTVRRVYRRLSLRFHPDKDSSDEARHAFEVLHTALETVIDPTKRADYIRSLSDADDAQRREGAASDDDVRQRQRTQQAQEEAQWAADLLAQREQQRRAREAAVRQAAQEREEAAQRLLAELTSELNTPFQQMEAELVRDWDVDEEMVDMKMKDVWKLLRQLAPAGQTGDPGEGAEYAADENAGRSRKRDRETAE
ncbi:DNAJ family-like protein [Leptomonas seymouri]|uniref:DNAJ family-like protein n=1 Tax=Leptomonas seymouri TaxID=5684 RepID=A0A0N1I5Q0_LEPSE|nr:DNAJ family-like protein [Leptomonas seymouri]|eukprot:KPI86043.1 DNAJ family-like protein [Leptomonas seymouri]